MPLSGAQPEERLEDLVESMMGEALLSLDKHGRRGTSEPIQWEITVDGLPYCYRCVAPMQDVSAPSDLTADKLNRISFLRLWKDSVYCSTSDFSPHSSDPSLPSTSI
jgi:hypothetical protein